MNEYDWMDGYPLPNSVLDDKKEEPSKQNEDARLCTWHTWETYRGLFDVFEYCKSCGIRREGHL